MARRVALRQPEIFWENNFQRQKFGAFVRNANYTVMTFSWPSGDTEWMERANGMWAICWIHCVSLLASRQVGLGFRAANFIKFVWRFDGRLFLIIIISDSVASNGHRQSMAAIPSKSNASIWTDETEKPRINGKTTVDESQIKFARSIRWHSEPSQSDVEFALMSRTAQLKWWAHFEVWTVSTQP